MPGVIICEVAAQLASYFVQKYDLLGAKVVGFGGLEEVKFRGGVLPGDRLVMVVQLLKVRRGAMIVCRFEGFVKESKVVNGILKGIPLPLDLEALGLVTAELAFRTHRAKMRRGRNLLESGPFPRSLSANGLRKVGYNEAVL